MANPIYDAVQNNKQNDIANQFSNFVNNFNNNFPGARPEEIGPKLVQNGVIPQNKFEQFRQIANMITGMNK